MEKLEATDWYIWWEKKGFWVMPHYVLVFENRPDNYQENYKVILVSQKGSARDLKSDPVMQDANGIFVQKRDMILYSCLFNPLKKDKFFLVNKD